MFIFQGQADKFSKHILSFDLKETKIKTEYVLILQEIL